MLFQAGEKIVSQETQTHKEGHSSGDHQKLVEERWKDIRSALKTKWSELTDQDLEMIDGDSRKLVALVSQKTSMPIHEIEESIDQIAAKSGGLLSRSVRATTEFAQTAQRSVSAPADRAYRQARKFVKQQPLPSVGAAFGVGMLVGLLVYGLSASDD